MESAVASSSSASASNNMTTGDSNTNTPGEEGILVAIRMRPLNSREQQSGSGGQNSNTTNNRVWRVLSKYNSITQCTPAGKPLPERIHNRTFFSYDKTFGESSTTRQVYEDTSKGIVESVVRGLNGTIFAYGQTSSGKTFTMQGSGTLQDGAAAGSQEIDGGGGIVHMAASDIFNHIEKEADRVFLIRVSFIEIYNEEVRDLLVSGDSKNNTTLAVREDKVRGVFVNSNETIVTSMDSLLSVLFAGEKNRSVAATGMNERSSRSHTIFRITVESRLKDLSETGKNDDMDEGEDEDMQREIDAGTSGAVRVSTLNLVDLAGSESVRHTGATGDRQKEGGIINQSLLTLSRVIGSLGQNATHVNFRDSKLTRILQPSLSGNARMAVICCATPSELYLEETRSTLQFASRAKLVKTRAQVNEVMDDRSLIKKLQRELKEARNGGPGKEAMEQMKALEEKAASAEYANRKAVEDLKRMKDLVLKGGVLQSSICVGKSDVTLSSQHDDGNAEAGEEIFSPNKCSRSKVKRRYSDSVIIETENIDPLQHVGKATSPARSRVATKLHAQTETKPKKSKPSSHFTSIHVTNEVNIGLLREALAAKSAQATSLKVKLIEVEQDIQSTSAQLQRELGEKELLRLEKQDLQSQVSTLASDKEFVVTECELIMAERERITATAQETIEKQASTVAGLQALVSSLQGELAAKEEEHKRDVQLLDDQISRQQAALEAGIVESQELKRHLQIAVDDKASLSAEKDNVNELVYNLQKSLTDITCAKEEETSMLQAKVEELQSSQSDLVSKCGMASERVIELTMEIDALRNEKDNLSLLLEESQCKVNAVESERDSNINMVVLAKSETEKIFADFTDERTRHAAAVVNCAKEIDSLKDQLSEAALQTIALKNELSTALSEKGMLLAQVESKTAELSSMQTESERLATNIDNLHSIIDTLTVERDLANERVASCLSGNEEVEKVLSSLHSERDLLASNLHLAKEEVSRLERERDEAISQTQGSQDSFDMLEKEVDRLSAEREAFKSEKDSLLLQLNKLTIQYDAVALDHKQCKVDAERVIAERDALAEVISNFEAVTKNDVAVASSIESCSLLSKEEVSRLEKERDEVISQFNTLEGTVGEMKREAERLMTELDKSRTENNALLSQVNALTVQYDDAVSKHKQSMCDYERIVGDHKVLASQHENVSSKMQDTITNLESSLKVKSDELLALNKTVQSFNAEKAEFSAQISMLTQERDDVIAKLEEARMECVTSRVREQEWVTKNQCDDVGDVKSLKDEIMELKSLLVSANASVDEARSAALFADNELDKMEMQLDNALRRLAESEEDRRIAEDKLRLVELSPRNSPARTDSEEELLREMEVLMGEKIDAESRLEQELLRRKDIEEEMKRASEEEKQLLLDEAEAKMASLRYEISQLKSDLSRVESDCYSMRDENSDLQDKIKRVEMRAADFEQTASSVVDELSKEKSEKKTLQEKLDALEAQSASFKSQVFAAKATLEAEARAKLTDIENQLNHALLQLSESRKEAHRSKETIAELNNCIEQYREEVRSINGASSNENEIERSKLREELAQMKFDLSQVEANLLSTKRELESAKEKIGSVKRHEQEKQQKFAAKAKETIEALKDRLAKAESAQHEPSIEESMQKELTELKMSLHDKDERIKKLEKTKITKSQIANIQKLKDERLQFMAEVKEYKQRVEELESRIPRRTGLQERFDSGSNQSNEIEKLQDDLRQCENKLRKYVQHSERLESERKQVFDSIASFHLVDVVGDSMIDMVLSICKKLTSVEEECAALSGSDTKAAEYLIELDSLRDKYSALEFEVQGFADKDEKMATALAECKDNLKKAQGKINALLKENESLKAMAERAKGNISELQSERRRLTQYLENENLQLGDELKRTKKELSDTKAEIDTIRKSAFNNEETVELQGLSSFLGGASSTKRVPSESSRNTTPLPPIRSKQTTQKLIPKQCPESPIIEDEGKNVDKENVHNSEKQTISSVVDSPFSSAMKQSANPFSSVNKAVTRKRRALTDQTPTNSYALGDSEPTVDVTSECKQS